MLNGLSQLKIIVLMKNDYDVVLLRGEHGIWLFIHKNTNVIFEQSGIKSLKEAMAYAAAVIEAEEK
jgi:hypothetical protein